MTNSNQSFHNLPYYPWNSSANKPRMNDALPKVPQMDAFKIMEEGIRKLNSGLDPNKAVGLDKLKPWVLNKLADVLAPMVTLISNASQKLQKVPRDWKTANIVQIFKNGEKYKTSNYHPVSLTCVLCKCMEHIGANQVMQHLTKNNILYNHQHGLRSKLSTEIQLIEFTEHMLRGMKDGKLSDVVQMDFTN